MTLISTKDKSFVRKWFVTVDPDVTGIDREYVEDIVSVVTNDLAPRSWKWYGYHFMMLSPVDGMRARSDPEKWIDTFWIRVSKPGTIQSECKFDNLSCADLSKNVIYLNEDRWKYGSDKVNMPIEVYRTYVVAHEIGHLLNHLHRTCSCEGCEGDVMQEFTRIGWKGCTPNGYALYD